uniref:Uncharacterized protein n=1 Tax=Rhizophora mucronata TaxID=61149 RepID=A0A2P2NRU3_RHIMU
MIHSCGKEHLCNFTTLCLFSTKGEAIANMKQLFLISIQTNLSKY